MAVLVDAVSSGHTVGGPSTTVSHTCTGSDRGLLVFVSVGTTAGNVTGMTVTCKYNGVDMIDIISGTTTATLMMANGSTSAGSVAFYLLNPASGTHNIVATASAGVGSHVMLVGGSVTGTNAVAHAVGTAYVNQGDSPTFPITSAVNNLAVCGASHGDTISGVSGTTILGVIDNFTPTTAGGNTIIGYTAGAPTSNINFTSGLPDKWNMMGLEFVAVATVPDAPTGLIGTPGDTTVSLAWTDNGAGSTDHDVDWALASAPTTWLGPVATGSATADYTVTGLTNGTGYVFRVRGVNAVGAGAWSASSGTVTPQAGVPQILVPLVQTPRGRMF